MYDAAETAVYDLCLAEGTFTSSTAFRDDWPAALSIGEPSLLVEQAGDTIEGDQISGMGKYGSQGKRTQQHEVGAWVVIPIAQGQGGDGEAVQQSKAIAERLANYIALYGKLNAAQYVKRASVVRIGLPVERLARVQGTPGLPTHICQKITVRIVTQQAWTMTEESE
jgi:hypothetical protein